MTLLDDYGFDASWSDGRDPMRLGRIVGEARGAVRVVTLLGIQDAQFAGSLRHTMRAADGLRPIVGDWVSLRPGPPLLIHEVLPRRTQVVRKEAGRARRQQILASNVDDAWIVCGIDEVNVRKLERFVAIVSQGGVRPHLVLNKIDRVADAAPLLQTLNDNFPQVPVVKVSARSESGLQPLLTMLQPRRTFALLGSSGVGKTTIVNHLLGKQAFATGETSADGRGRHTTTGRSLVVLEGGALLMDTPGLREVGIGESQEGVDAAFADVVDFAGRCRFSDCKHAREPGCAIIAAIGRGDLSQDRFEAWQRLHAEITPFTETHQPRRK